MMMRSDLDFDKAGSSMKNDGIDHCRATDVLTIATFHLRNNAVEGYSHFTSDLF